MKLAQVTNPHKILVTSMIHGDEKGSDIVCERLQKVFPSIDYDRKLNKTGERSFEGMDPNRSFPDKTSLSRRLSKKIFKYDTLIDIHCAGFCKPFVLIDPTPMQEEISGWAAWSGLTVAVEGSTFNKENLDKSWAGYTASLGKRAITVEVDSKDEKWYNIAVTAIINLIHFYDYTKPSKIYMRENIETGTRGKVEYHFSPGSTVEKGSHIATVSGITVLSKYDGIILSWASTVGEDGYLGMIGI